MRQADIDEMRALPIFDGVAEHHVEAMLKAAFLQRFPPMVELVREGEPADFLHLIVEGVRSRSSRPTATARRQLPCRVPGTPSSSPPSSWTGSI